MAKEVKENHRNEVRQVITLEDGIKKVVFHAKKFNQPQYADRKRFWKHTNEMPKVNSKSHKAKVEKEEAAQQRADIRAEAKLIQVEA